jgi:hypothetical protein
VVSGGKVRRFLGGVVVEGFGEELEIFCGENLGGGKGG